jgi:excisionase family DNA binding protein
MTTGERRHNLEKAAYSVTEACVSLSIGRTLFYQLVASGDLVLIKIGKRSLVPAESINRYLNRLIEASRKAAA